ncbi:MAG: Fic family protein [Oscillospiraceae bacterium]|nr:Fic family protein [Oscillospiraceae bacterium]
MRKFNYSKIPMELMSADIMNLVAAIHEYKGKQDLYIEAKPDVLEAMYEIARVQSTKASNSLEGIYTTDKRLNDIMNMKIEPKTRSEREIAGYRDALRLIHENYDYMLPNPNIILQLHRDIYRYNLSSTSGMYKSMDNTIIERDSFGNETVRFKPLSAFETPTAIENLSKTYIDSINKEKYNALLLIFMFILDFLCIHPFNDGNGRVSRLLTLLLLYRSGYIVGKYISIEMIIEKTKETYYEVLLESSRDWHKHENIYYPFIKYSLEICLRAYRDFESHTEYIQHRKLSKPERIRKLFDSTLQKLSKKEIRARCPDISISTIEITLLALVKEGYILKIGAGKNTVYIRNML